MPVRGAAMAARLAAVVAAALGLAEAAQACSPVPYGQRLEILAQADTVALAELTGARAAPERGQAFDYLHRGPLRPAEAAPPPATLWIAEIRTLATLAGPHRAEWTLLWRGGEIPSGEIGQRGYIGIMDPGRSEFGVRGAYPVHTGAGGAPLHEILPDADFCACDLMGSCAAGIFHFGLSEAWQVRERFPHAEPLK